MRSLLVKIFGVMAGAVLVLLGYFWFPVVPPVQKADLTTPAAQEFIASFMAHRMPEASANIVPDDRITLSDGREEGLRRLVRGKWTVLNLWATWCAPCVHELPSLAKLQDKYKGRLNVLALSFDNNTDVTKLAQFMAKNKVEGLPFAYDAALKVRTSIPTEGLPTSLILDPNGKIIVILEGHTDWVSDKASAFFDQILIKS